ncbi:unnamed protein product [Aphanomyces euteiches]
MTNLTYTHPRTYGKDSKHCRACATTRGVISKYGLNMCRRCFRERATQIGFVKTWTKASATPPVEIDLPWETSDDNPPPKHDAQEKPKNPPKQSNLTEKKKLQESKRVTNIKRSPTKTMTISPEKHSIASAQEGMPETPSKVIPAASIEEMNPKAIKQMSTIPIENHAKVTFEMPSTPQGSDKEVPSTAQPLRLEVLVPSSIGPQVSHYFAQAV